MDTQWHGSAVRRARLFGTETEDTPSLRHRSDAIAIDPASGSRRKRPTMRLGTAIGYARRGYAAALLNAAAGAAALVFVPTSAGAQQQPIVYPTRGQSADKTEQDKAECMVWSKQQTGIDPMAPPPQAGPPPSSAQGPQRGQPGILRGAAGGAALGAVGGAIAGDAGKGAAIGAATGGMVGGFRK